MTSLERFVYVLALAIFRAWFDLLDARKTAERETVTDEDRARSRRFRDAVERVLQERRSRDPGSDDPARTGK